LGIPEIFCTPRAAWDKQRARHSFGVLRRIRRRDAVKPRSDLAKSIDNGGRGAHLGAVLLCFGCGWLRCGGCGSTEEDGRNYHFWKHGMGSKCYTGRARPREGVRGASPPLQTNISCCAGIPRCARNPLLRGGNKLEFLKVSFCPGKKSKAPSSTGTGTTGRGAVGNLNQESSKQYRYHRTRPSW
jgi:hypothetical protein